MSAQDIKYRFALDEKMRVVDVRNLSKRNSKDRKNYECLACQRVLRPVLGEIQQKHFRHKVADNCSLQTYLHKIGIWLFQEAYNECLDSQQPFQIEVQQNNQCNFCPDGPCTLEPSSIHLDLTQTYDCLIVETFDRVKENFFIPDILLSNDNGDKLYIEIAVTHKASPEKIDSDVPIIEIELEDENDLDPIFEKKLSHKDRRTRFINFKIPPNKVDYWDKCKKFTNRVRDQKHDQQAKSIFKEIYEEWRSNNRPLYIGIKRRVFCTACDGGPCERPQKEVKVDLIKGFPEIIETPGDSGLRNSRLAIQDKSGRRIHIETTQSLNYLNDSQKNEIGETLRLNIGSMKKLVANLEDPKLWNNHHYFHNFDPHVMEIKDSSHCNLKIEIFIVKENGKSLVTEIPYYEYKYKKQPHYYSNIIKDINLKAHAKFIKEVETAFAAGIAIKNCYLCRYHAGANNFDENHRAVIFCKFLKSTCKSNKAAECEYYRPDVKVLGTERYPRRIR